MRHGRAAVGHPVDVASGTVYLTRDDIGISGKLDLVWERRYSTSLLDSPGALGPGWLAPRVAALTQAGEEFLFVMPEGGTEIFADPFGIVERGGVVRRRGSFEELRRWGNRYVVTRWDVDSGRVDRCVF